MYVTHATMIHRILRHYLNGADWLHGSSTCCVQLKATHMNTPTQTYFEEQSVRLEK